MAHTIEIESLSVDPDSHALIDVRSPSEYARGHIPNAINIPLMDDKEREKVGICYKNEGKQAAVLLGLELIGPKMRTLAESALGKAHDQPIVLYCWRGGMRSNSMSWLLDQVGVSSSVVPGGYKEYRRAAQRAFAKSRSLVILSGMTGAGKTHMLRQVEALGEQVIDLEALANHRGSSFGGIGLPTQPTCEQFENELFHAVRQFKEDRPIWLEDESPAIGKIRIPSTFWDRMRESPAIFLDVDAKRRAKNLATEYGELDQEELVEAVERLRKRIGGLCVQQSIRHITSGRYEEAAIALLSYYDKTYGHASSRRPRTQITQVRGDVQASEVVALGRSFHGPSTMTA